MSRSVAPITVLVCSCIFALSACIPRSSPRPETPVATTTTPATTTPSPTPTTSPSPTGVPHSPLEDKPMRGLIVQDLIKDPFSKYGNLSRFRATDPATGEVVAMRIFRSKPASDSSITSSGALDCSFNYCYSRDFSYVAAGWYVDGDSGLQGAHVGYVDTDDNITDMSAAVPSLYEGRPYSDYSPTFSADDYFYFKREYDEDDGRRTLYYRLKIGSTQPELLLNIEPSDPSSRYLSLLSGTKLATESGTQYAEGNDKDHMCWSINASVSRNNECFDYMEGRGIFVYTASGPELDRSTFSGEYYQERSIYKPYDDARKCKKYGSNKIVLSPDQQQIAFTMWNEDQTDFALHILNVDGTGDHTVPVINDGVDGFEPIAWLD